MNWFRLYTEVRNDAKLRTLSDAQFRTWIRLLCYAAEQPERGSIEGIPEHLLALEVAEGDADLLRVTCNALHSLRVVTWRYTQKDVLDVSFLNFEKRQFSTPSDDRERVRARVAKHRESKRSVNVKESVTDVTRYSNGVTCGNGCNDPEQSRADTEQIRSEEISPTPLFRDDLDLGEIREAESLLRSDLRTESIGVELGRQHSLPGSLEIPGWKWLRAARKLASPGVPDSKRKWSYFVGIARGLTDDEREDKPAKPVESKAQRKQRELAEGFARRHAEAQAAARGGASTDGR